MELLFLDNNMPRMTGFEFGAEAKEWLYAARVFHRIIDQQGHGV